MRIKSKVIVFCWITFLVLVCPLIMNAQCGGILISTQESIDDFSTNNPTCFTFEDLGLKGEEINNLLGLSQITGFKNLDERTPYELSIRNTSITNFEGLDELENHPSQIYISDNKHIKNLNGLDLNMTTIFSAVDIANNEQLQRIDINFDLGTKMSVFFYKNFSLDTINITGGNAINNLNISSCPNVNNLDAWSTITEIRKCALSNNGAFRDFSGFKNVKSISSLLINKSADDSTHQTFESFEGMDSLNSIGELYISGVKSLKGLEAVQTLKSLTINGSYLPENSMENLEGLENLVYIEEDFTITDVDILNNLEALNNNLEIGGVLTIIGNNSLEICGIPAICNHISQGRPYRISNNGRLCNSIVDVLSSCEEQQAVPFRIFYDLNADGIFNSLEPSLQDISVVVEPTNFVQINPSDRDYQIVLLNGGNHVLSFTNNAIWELTTDSSEYQIYQDTIYSDKVLNFGFTPVLFKSEISSYAVTISPRCNSIIPADIIATNNGSTIANGFLWLKLSDNIDSIKYLNSFPDTVIDVHHFGFRFSNLHPGNSLKKSIKIGIPGIPDIMIGDSFHIKSYITYKDENGEHITDKNALKDGIQCSYDPNDKLVNPKRPNDDYTLIGEPLHYTVRFQNTGNAEAFDVVVRDTLDPNLDVSTFKLIGSSHEEILQTFIKDDQYITFEFKNIFLPDSTTDFEGSNGYVSYTIEAKEGIDENTLIENTAHIYFDFNPPIVTNTTQSIMVSMFPTSTNNLNQDLDIRMYPNPTEGVLHFDGEDFERDAMVEVMDLNGRILKSFEMEGSNTISMGSFQSGMYFVKVIQAEGYFINKIYLHK